MEIHNILVPTDFSAYAEYVFQQALVLAARDKAHVLLLHVLRRCEAMWPEGVWPTRAQLVQELQAEVEQRLQAAAATQPLPIETLAVWGSPATEICRIAREYGIDLIVMSSRRRTDLAHIFMGSVTEHVVRYAPCSVLILRTFQPKTARLDQSSILRYLHQRRAGKAYMAGCASLLGPPRYACTQRHLVRAEKSVPICGDQVTHGIADEANG